MNMNNQWLLQTDRKQYMGRRRVDILVNFIRQCCNEKKCENNQKPLQLLLVEKCLNVYFHISFDLDDIRHVCLQSFFPFEHNQGVNWKKFKLICGIKCTISQSRIFQKYFNVW